MYLKLAPMRKIKPAGDGRRVLFVSRQRLIGATNGSSAYLLDLAAAVRSAGFEPHLMQPSPDLMGRWPVLKLRQEMQVFESHRIRGVARFGPWVVSLDPSVYRDAVTTVLKRSLRTIGARGRWLADRPRPYAIAVPWTEADRRFLRSVSAADAAARDEDIVIADYAFQSEAFALLPHRRCAIVMHDLFHARTANGQDRGRDSVAALDRETEITLLARADAVIAIQADEARFIAENVAGTKAILVPMAAHPAPEPQLGQADRLLFVGSNSAPNVIALEWFFEFVWPTVRAAAPSTRLDVAGSVAGAFPGGGPPGVAFQGMVDDLQASYTSAGIVISPLTFGSGLKVKLVEALANGKAIVATGVTLQGVEQACANAVIRADDPEAFAAAILVLRDVQARHRLAVAALQAARDHFSPSACHAEFIAWLKADQVQSPVETEECAA